MIHSHQRIFQQQNTARISYINQMTLFQSFDLLFTHAGTALVTANISFFLSFGKKWNFSLAIF